jgi:hypothetical protein
MVSALRCAWIHSLLALVVLSLCAGAYAQGGTGELSGLVTDPTGAVVAGATVTLTNPATKEIRTTTTTAAGIYTFPALAVGAYSLELSPKGFKSVRVHDVVLSVGGATTRDVKLEVGTQGEQVTVEAGAQTVQTTESSISDLVDRRVWEQMPLETRDQNQFINLLAGAAQGNVALNLANGGTDRGAAVNGTRSGAGNYLLEGFDNNDQGQAGAGSIGASTGGANTTISPDAIQEYRVIEHIPPAEYGKGGGFVTDMVLKSGTDDWHGSLFEYNRIQALAANSWFSDKNGTKDSLVRNQFGGSVGGPVVKGKTFFYFTTEFRRDRQKTPLSGNALTPDFINFFNNGSFEQFMEGTGIYAGAGGACDAFLGGPCPGGFSNEATLGPIAANLLATPPNPLCTPSASNCARLSNSGVLGGNLLFGGITFPVPVFGQVTVPQSAPFDQARYTTKFDQRLSNNDQLAAAFAYDNGDTTVQWAGGSSTFGPDEPVHQRAMNVGVTWAHTFSPTILNQAKVAYTRHTGNFPGSAAQNQAGIPAIFTFFDPLNMSFGNGQGFPQFFTENRFTYKDDLSVTKGKHNFKTGFEYSRTRNGSSFDSNFNGTFAAYGMLDILSDFKIGHDSDAVLFGGPNYGSWYYAQATVNPTVTPATRPVYYRGFRANEFGAYFQDDWRATQRLTLNLGVRWDYFGPPHNFRPNLDSNFYSGAPIEPICTATSGSNTASGPCTIRNEFYPVGSSLMQAFAHGAPAVRNNEIWNKDTNNFAPRIGFAWDATGRQKLVVRGGFGINYDRLYNNVFENLRFNPPFFCFCKWGAFVNGNPGDNITTPGFYTVPFSTSSVALFGSSVAFPGGVPLAAPRAIDQNLVTAYYEQSNLGFQYDLGRGMVWETDYVGTLGRKLVGIKNLNTFDGRRAGGLNPDNPFGQNNATSRPNATVGSINLRTNGFSSNYHALQTGLRKRFSNGLQFDANYTYSKALDQVSDTFTPRGGGINGIPKITDSLDPHLDYGPADFNIKHRFVVSYSYDLPFFKGNRWLGAWSVNGIIDAQSGVPFSPFDLTGQDANKDGIPNDRAAFVGTGSVKSALTGKNPGEGFFNPADFAAISPGNPYPYDPVAAGNQLIGCPPNVNSGLWCEGAAARQVGRNALVGPKYVDVDFGIVKKFRISERAGLSFQASFFNLFNHPNFAIPDANFADCAYSTVTNGCTGTFGSSTATFAPGQGGARVTQLALRFDF